MAYRFSNRASSLIVIAVTTASNTITLEAGGGSKLPILNTANADVVQGTLIAATGVTEIVQVTNISGDVLTVTRGQEGTSVTSFPVGSRFEVRLTTRVLDAFLQRTGGTMLGDINMNNHTLQNYRQPQAVLIDEIHTRVIRSPSVPLSVPGQVGEKFINFVGNGAQQPQIVGWPIATFEYLQGIVFDWLGDISNVPVHLLLCDGSNGTPDLRGLFVKCYNNDANKGPVEGVNARGGARSATTSSNGSHSHGGGTGFMFLDKTRVPGHIVTTTGFPAASGGNDRLTSVIVTHDDTKPEHNHPIADAPDHNHGVATQPPYICLAKVLFRPPPYSF